MAITNAQQYQQLVNKPANGKRPGYRGDNAYGRSSKSEQARSFSAATSRSGNVGGAPTQTRDNSGNVETGGDAFRRSKKEFENKLKADNARREKEKQRLKNLEAKAAKEKREKEKAAKNLSNLGKSKTTKFGNVKTSGLTAKERYLSELAGIDPEDDEIDRTGISQIQEFTDNQRKNRYTDEIEDLFPEDKVDLQDFKLSETEQKFKDFIDNRNTVPTFGVVPSLLEDPLQKFSNYSASINRPFFEDVVRKGKIPGVNLLNLNNLDLEKAYDSYMADRLAGKIDAYGNPLGGNYYDSSGQLVVTDTRDDGAGQKILPEDTMGDTEEEEVINPRDYTGLAPRFMGSIFDFSGPQFAAEGGIMRAGYMDGGRMRQMEMMQDEDDPTGGIMDLESGRQMYFLGKLVKKAGRAIKKVVKSPIGKAALLYFGGNALMSGGGGGLSSLFKSGKGLSLKNLIMGKPLGFKTAGDSVARSGGLLNFIKDNPYLSILGGSTALAGLFGKDKDEDGPMNYGPDINIDAIRANPYKFLPAGIIGSNYQTGTEGRKDGGRMGYQEGGDAEPVAKKTMPLLDMDGMEKDYREEGGFVPIGRMERADDVPARLSKNEFVFTADAVRNAGDGDIDKGAEVMYNMMKNLESGGEVSEESQGLDGAREMFQTSKRLEEVL
jgi:hypothetical protein